MTAHAQRSAVSASPAALAPRHPAALSNFRFSSRSRSFPPAFRPSPFLLQPPALLCTPPTVPPPASPSPPPASSPPPTHAIDRLLHPRTIHWALALLPALHSVAPVKFSFNNTVSNPFSPSATLGSGSICERDARSGSGAPTDQSLAPPAMPARPDFELYEAAATVEDRVVAEALHVATVDMDDMLDVELDVGADTDAEADTDANVDAAGAEGDDITTAAQSWLH
ncbi:hypothetical protein BC834DRAFT_974383 [Gloeopeniophorella convolvens]|nr:hypothetical protein BC834DRAFT_974383 [Gloeopeniophorella convolvens]